MKNLRLAAKCICLVGTTYFHLVQADNPIVPYVGMADPHIHIFNNKAYMYATRDADSISTAFNMPDWKIWSSSDLIHWTLERTIKPEETYIGPSTSCWATDAAFKNGSYYMYFSNGNTNTGVMRSKSPSGPFTDALGKPLLAEDLTPSREYDPTVLVDDDKDKTAYIAFGLYIPSADTNFYYYIAKLNDDMISLAESPKKIEFTSAFKASDKPNLNKRNGIYYLSCGANYATSQNVYGPYTNAGNSGGNNAKYGLTTRAHGNYFEWHNQTYHTWCHFHLGKEVARYRESYITYLHYTDEGKMVDDVAFLDAHFSAGVGQYDASWVKIEAEWYFEASNTMKMEKKGGGFEVQAISNGSYLSFPKIKNIPANAVITFNVSSNKSATIEVRSDSEAGPLLGSCKVQKTGGLVAYKDITCNLKNTKGTKNLYFVFKGASGNLLRMDNFRFNQAP